MSKQPIRATPSSDAVIQTLKWAEKNGFRPVPLHPQSKAAINRAYVALDYKPPTADLWRSNNYGVGVVTGPAHSGPVDTDLDCEEAVYFARIFLPQTDAVFGRESKPASHYLYRVDTPLFDKRAFNDPTNEQCIIEARGDAGHQTVMPGSLHEDTGEEIRWETVAFPEVPTVTADQLLLSIRKIAIATLIVRHIWNPGYHNEPCKHLTGLFFYLDWPLEEVEQMIEAVMAYTSDDDKSRLPTVRATYRRAAEGKKVSGAGVLRKQLNNDKLVDRLLEWAGSPTVNLMQEYNDRFAVVSVGGKFRIADFDVPAGEPPTFFVKDDWMNMRITDYTTIEGKPVPKCKLWLANPRRRSYNSVDFLPGVEDADVLNLWTGWAIKPQEGKCDAWFDLVHNVICGGDDTLFRWLLHWFANIVREPRDKSLTAPVIIGVEGAGKSLMLEYFGRILGPGYVTVTKEEHIVGRFNSHMGSTLLLHSEEALYGGDKRHAGIIRSLITDPWHMFEQKGIDAKKVRNYLRLVLTSNDIHAAPAKPGDRRYTVIDMGKRKASDDLVREVLAELRDGGPAALHAYLLQMDYDEQLPRTNVKNEGLLALKSINMNPVESWWYETLCSGMVLPDFLNWATFPVKVDWPPVVGGSALHASMLLKLRDRSIRQVPADRALLFQIEKFVGASLRRGQRSFDNPLLDEYPPLVKMLNSRQSSVLDLPSLADCRSAFVQYLGQPIEWPEDDDTVAPPRKEHEKF